MNYIIPRRLYELIVGPKVWINQKSIEFLAGPGWYVIKDKKVIMAGRGFWDSLKALLNNANV